MGAEERRAILRAYIQSLPGGRREFQRRSKLTRGRITQLLDAEEAFGERAAANLARRLELDPGYFNRTQGEFGLATSSLPSKDVKRLVDLWERLLPAQRRAIMDTIQTEAARNVDAAEHMRNLNVRRIVTDPAVKKSIDDAMQGKAKKGVKA